MYVNGCVSMKLIHQFHTEEQVSNFTNWIDGQTTSNDGVYVDDYESWVRQGMPKKYRGCC